MNATPLPLAPHTTPADALDSLVARLLTQTLPAPEAALLRLRFGLDRPPCPPATAARHLGLPLAAARRIERRALRRLRADALAWPEDVASG